MKKPDLQEIAFRMREKGLSSDGHTTRHRVEERIIELFNDELSEWAEEVMELLSEMEEEGKKITKAEYDEKYSD